MLCSDCATGSPLKDIKTDVITIKVTGTCITGAINTITAPGGGVGAPGDA